MQACRIGAHMSGQMARVSHHRLAARTGGTTCLTSFKAQRWVQSGQELHG